MSDDSGMPDPRFSYRRQPPFLDLTFAVMGWTHRASAAVGSDRFAETLGRAEFYLGRALTVATTPGERAIVTGLAVTINDLITANAQARVVLADSVSGMDAAEATEFVELCESGENSPD